MNFGICSMYRRLDLARKLNVATADSAIQVINFFTPFDRLDNDDGELNM